MRRGPALISTICGILLKAKDAPYFENGQFDSQTGVPFANRQDGRENIWGFFGQDDIKVLPTLTINLGLRWTDFGAFATKQNNLDVVELGEGPNALTDLHIRVGGSLYTPQKSNFGPMVGFAWSPSKYGGKAVFRGGFGVSYNENEIAITTNGSGNPPNAVQANYTCPYPFNNNPSCAGTGILYETATSPTSIFGYAPNPNTITTFGPDNLPINSQPILVSGFPSNPKSIVVYHYSFDFQYQLPANWVMTMSYMGNQTRHLLIHSNWNAIGAAAGFALNPKVNNLNFWDNSGDGNFNAGIFSIAHNFSHSFQISAAYTWSKAMDENSGPYYRIRTLTVRVRRMDDRTITRPICSNCMACGSLRSSTTTAGVRR